MFDLNVHALDRESVYDVKDICMCVFVLEGRFSPGENLLYVLQL